MRASRRLAGVNGALTQLLLLFSFVLFSWRTNSWRSCQETQKPPTCWWGRWTSWTRPLWRLFVCSRPWCWEPWRRFLFPQGAWNFVQSRLLVVRLQPGCVVYTFWQELNTFSLFSVSEWIRVDISGTQLWQWAQEVDVEIFLLRAAANQNKPSLKGNDDNVELWIMQSCCSITVHQ